ncbi:MAG: hypothetical protein JST00_25740 [Deltaproteobacteria bacterium]|nr:hypothetical protein [Deltaproteobacteria bacterium]
MRAEALRREVVVIVVAIVLHLFLLEGRARANVARSSFDGDRYGVLAARSEGVLQVDSEDLVFELAGDLASARVTATYRFSNPSPESRRVDAAFVFVQGDASSKIDSAATLTVDGAPAKFSVVTDAQQLRPALDAWIAAHSEKVAQKGSDREPTALRVLVEARDAGVDNDELVMRAAREVIPEAVKEMEKGFTSLGAPRRLTWLSFPIEVPPKGKRVVAVAYTHTPGQDLAKRVDTTFTYEYLLSPAKTWASFGPLHVDVRLPPRTLAESPLPWRAEGPSMRVDFEALPEGELVFEVMSKKNLWLGMTTPPGYWAIASTLLAAVAITVGRLGGRSWGRRGSGGIAALGWGAGILIVTGIASTFTAVVVSAIFPDHAFGFGYGPTFGLFVAVLGASVVSVIVAARARKRVRAAVT